MRLRTFGRSRKGAAVSEAFDRERAIARQVASEQNYFEAGRFTVHPACPDVELSAKDIYARMEVDHCVKTLPTLEEMARQQERTNEVAYVVGRAALGAKAMNDYPARTTTEGELIKSFLSDTQYFSGGSSKARTLPDEISFIGGKELKEAAGGIADYWKERLGRNPDEQLYVVTGELARIDADYNFAVGAVKSDEYLMEEIIQNFSEEELAELSGRLLTSRDQIPNNCTVIFLDDWTVSGTEMYEQYAKFVTDNLSRNLASKIEIQLAVASQRRICTGFDIGGTQLSLVTRAYFAAHDANCLNEVYTTGAHSSDLSIARTMERICDKFGAAIPGLLQVLRPYRQEGFSLTFYDKIASSRK